MHLSCISCQKDAALLLIFYHIIDRNGLCGWIQVYQKRSEEEANAEPLPVALESSPSPWARASTSGGLQPHLLQVWSLHLSILEVYNWGQEEYSLPWRWIADPNTQFHTCLCRWASNELASWRKLEGGGQLAGQTWACKDGCSPGWLPRLGHLLIRLGDLCFRNKSSEGGWPAVAGELSSWRKSRAGGQR